MSELPLILWPFVLLLAGLVLFWVVLYGLFFAFALLSPLVWLFCTAVLWLGGAIDRRWGHDVVDPDATTGRLGRW